MSADAITFARPASGRATLAKIIRVEGDRIIGKEPAPNVGVFSYVEAPVHDLGSLYIAVKRAADQGAIAIRAKPKKPIGNRRMHLRSDGIQPDLDRVPRRWCAFDWDGLPLEMQPCPNPSWIWHPDPLLEPWVGARIALRRLPPAFRDVSCFWQVSAGAGFNYGFRLRTWHWLNCPVTGGELKVWLHPAIERGLVDPVTLVEVQPHYLGVRVLGGADPCPRRFGFLRLAKQEVQVPDIEGIKRRQEEIERAKRAQRERDAPVRSHGKHPAAPFLAKHGIEMASNYPNAQSYAQSRIDECLAAIRSASARHTTYKAEAARAKAICDRHGLDWQPIRRDLIAAYESALTPTEARERRSFSTEGVLDWLEARSAA
jgi:hypothetical protein